MERTTSLHSGLPVSLGALLTGVGVEGNRIEFKASWNAMTEPSVVETVCAFANDLLNLNGGYIILGVAEAGGRAVLPPTGIADPDHTQKKVYEACRRISPEYQPRQFVERLDGKHVVVLWCPGGDLRPYHVRRGKEGDAFFVRQGAITAQARGDTLRQLFEQTARVPFDERPCAQASLLDLSSHTVRSFLREVGSDLYEAPLPAEELFARLNLTRGANGHSVPRMAAILFFCDDPERFLPGAHIEVARFSNEADQTLEERVFRGPLHEQLRACLTFLEGQSGTWVTTSAGDIRASRAVAYPAVALREATVNAVYHRGYAEPRHPIKIYLYPDRISVTSYPGPHPNIRPEHLGPGRTVPPGIPARNRRVGEFLKELRLAEARGTGIPKIIRVMQENGSPPPEFDFYTGEETGYFSIILPIHPDHAQRLGVQLYREGHKEAALALLQRAHGRQPAHAPLAAQLIEHLSEEGRAGAAKDVLSAYRAATTSTARDGLPIVVLIRHLSEAARRGERHVETPALIAELLATPETLNAEALRELARALHSIGLIEETYALAERAHRLRPRSPEVMSERIWATRQLAERHSGEIREQLLLETLELLSQIGKKRSYDIGQYLEPVRDAIHAELGLAPDEFTFR